MTMREAIPAMLAAGPMTVDELHRRLTESHSKVPSPGTVRTLCNELQRAGTLSRVLVRTPRNRNGIALWHLRSEAGERVSAAVALLQRDPRSQVSFGGLRA